MCGFVNKLLDVDGEIRIWPHHFDTGIYVLSRPGMHIGFGLAMADALSGSPYFYMAGYPTQDGLDYSKIPSLNTGRWEIGEHWNGAILPIPSIQKDSVEEMHITIKQFVTETMNFFTTN